MKKSFNITGACFPEQHYMVNLDSRLAEIKQMVDSGKYFVINRGRQYGKTTTIGLLEKLLKNDYIVISMDFQRQMSQSSFATEQAFVTAFERALLQIAEFSPYQDFYHKIKDNLGHNESLVELFNQISRICRMSQTPIVLIIDEVDQASNNQVFLDFLAQLRGYYLDRYKTPTFKSVILAGVHDVRNLRQKIRPDTEHKHNSPWNIASPFEVDMSFSQFDIAGMLTEYENDKHTGMNISEIAGLIYDYTSGYPVLVSTICKHIDEKQKLWNKESVILSVKAIMFDRIPLLESLINKLEDNDTLRNFIKNMLFNGQKNLYSSYDATIQSAIMYGFIKNNDGTVAIANRIFETVIYDWFISTETTQSEIFAIGMNYKNQFISNNSLNMELILEKFALHFNEIYGTQPDKFIEEEGRKLFLLYLRPIINGVGNYYIEAQTRDYRRTDIIVDYLGKQYIIELKIWRGEEYNSRGEQQLIEYLDYYRIDKGYLVSFNFNKNKTSQAKTITLGDRQIIEIVV